MAKDFNQQGEEQDKIPLWKEHVHFVRRVRKAYIILLLNSILSLRCVLTDDLLTPLLSTISLTVVFRYILLCHTPLRKQTSWDFFDTQCGNLK